MLTVRAGGVLLHSLVPNGAVSPVSFTTSMRGSLVAEWSMWLPRGFTHPALRQGVLVEVMAGALCVWSGTMAEPDRNEWKFTADGLHRRGERFEAVWEDGVVSLDDAIDDAIIRGLPWVRPESISTTFMVEEGQTISRALDAYCESASQQWMVDPAGNVRVYDLPTGTDWVLSPEVPAMPTADDDYASALRIIYSSGTTTVSDPAAAERWGPAEATLDVSTLGLAASEAAGEAVLATMKARPAFTDGIEVSRARLTNPGGVSPALWQVRAGVQRVAHRGVLTADGAPALGPLSWVVGATSYTDGSDVIALTPMGRLPRTQAEVVAQQQADIQKLYAEGLA